MDVICLTWRWNACVCSTNPYEPLTQSCVYLKSSSEIMVEDKWVPIKNHQFWVVKSILHFHLILLTTGKDERLRGDISTLVLGQESGECIERGDGGQISCKHSSGSSSLSICEYSEPV